jgi:hypothetical protein
MRDGERTFEYNRLLGDKVVIEGCYKVEFAPTHVVFLGAAGFIIKAENNIHVNNLMETTNV